MTERFQLVGSLLRPQELLDYKDRLQLRADVTYPFYDDEEGYRETEIAATKQVIADQIEHGIDVLTDGEFTKALWHTDFVWGLGGVQRVLADHGYYFRELDGEGVYETRRDIGVKVVAPLSGKNHHFIECWQRVVAEADGRATKQCIPSPAHIYGELSGVLSGAPVAGSQEGIYADRAELKAGLLAAYKEFVTEYAAAGGKILQLDDCLWEAFAEDNAHSPFKKGGSQEGNGREVAEEFVAINNELIDFAHELGLTVWTHNCRGNYASRNMGEGSYEAIADLFLSQQHYDRFFLEWDDDRAGSLDALKVFEGRDVEVVLGVLSSKTTDLDDEERALRLLEQASTIIPKDKLFISHQCGFASCDNGNELASPEQWAKVEQGRKLAKQFWG